MSEELSLPEIVAASNDLTLKKNCQTMSRTISDAVKDSFFITITLYKVV
jgi:hypothetical protein